MTESLTPSSLAELSSAALTHRLGELFGEERRCLVDFLWHFAEMDRRHGFVELGYSSSFAWCTKALKMSDGSAWLRVTSARLLRRFPVIDSYLRDGRLCMTTLVALREVLDDENHGDLLERAADHSEDEVKVLVATLRPRPEVRESIRPVQSRAVVVTDAPSLFAPAPKSENAPTAPAPAREGDSTSRREQTVNTPVVLVPLPPPPPRIEPIDAQRYSIRFTAGPELMDLLKEARSALSHVVPDGNLEALLAHCLRKTLEQTARRQRGALVSEAIDASAEACGASETGGADAAPAPEGDACEPLERRMAAKRKAWSRYVSAAVRRAVWKRDGGRCSFVGPDGHRCNSTWKLQLDHLQPHAWGGEATVENLALRCANHNLHRAREHFGAAHMAKYTDRSPLAPRRTRPCDPGQAPDSAGACRAGSPSSPSDLSSPAPTSKGR